MVETMDRTDIDILAWHIDTFPNATLESQLLKLEEEMDEVDRATDPDDVCKEFADLYIVSVVLDKRFDSIVGRHFLNFIKRMPIGDRLKEEVEHKMEINKSRNWIYKDGVYRHGDR